MSKRVTKLFTTKATSIDDETKSVIFTISTREEDRYGEVVDQASWDFKSYEKNPLVIWGHDPSEPENVLGQGSELQVSKDGSKTTARLTFATDINAKAALVWELIKRGILRTVSVGFMNHSWEVEDDVPILKDNELLEISVVPIPANAGAVALGLKAGDINTKDAKWLMESMRDEADRLERQLAVAKPKEKSMTEEQATALIDSITELKATVEAQNDRIEEQGKTIAELKEAADKPADPPADTTSADDTDQTDETDPAKGGDDDQPGAGEPDDIDDDTELTPELQAQIDAEFAEADNQ